MRYPLKPVPDPYELPPATVGPESYVFESIPQMIRHLERMRFLWEGKTLTLLVE